MFMNVCSFDELFISFVLKMKNISSAAVSWAERVASPEILSSGLCEAVHTLTVPGVAYVSVLPFSCSVVSISSQSSFLHLRAIPDQFSLCNVWIDSSD